MLMVDEERALVGGLIQRAIDNGWEPRVSITGTPETISTFDVYKYGTKKITFFNQDGVDFKVHLFDILFSHSFAEAIWGDKYAFHMKKLVMAYDRLEYLSNNT